MREVLLSLRARIRADIHHGPGRRASGAGARPDGTGADRIFGERISSTAKRAKLAECLAFASAMC
jgi:hypothetical protein